MRSKSPRADLEDVCPVGVVVAINVDRLDRKRHLLTQPVINSGLFLRVERGGL